MAVSIAKLAIQFVADTSGMIAGTKKAEGALSGFVSTASGLGNKLAGAFGFVGASAALVGFVASVRQSFKELDDLAKMSTKLGVPVEQLQLLDHAASLSGASTEQVAKAFAKMNDNIGEAISGTKAQKEAFAALGLSADKLAAKAPQEAFLDIADALNKIPSQAMKTKLGMDVFGRSMVDLLPLLAEGREGIERLFAEREGMGLFSREDLRRVEEANDAWDSMLTSIKQISGEIAVVVAPAMRDMAESGIEIVKSFREWRELQNASPGKVREAQFKETSTFGEDLPFANLGSNIGLAIQKATLDSFENKASAAVSFKPTEERLAEWRELSGGMEAAMDGLAARSEAFPDDASANRLKLAQDNMATTKAISDSLTPDEFAAGKDADKLFGRLLKPALGNAVDFLKQADADLAATLANTFGDKSFTGDALGTAAKIMESGVDAFAEASATASKNVASLAASPVAGGQAAALQRGTAEALTMARQNVADQQRAQDLKLQQEQAKSLAKIEKNTGTSLKDFKVVTMN